MSVNANDIELPTRPIALFATFISGVLVSAALGGLTNAVNGVVSPEYYVFNLVWLNGGDVWRSAIAQGVIEGTGFGFVFSMIFTIGIGIMTRVACGYTLAIRHLTGIVLGALVCWVLGGILSLVLALLCPNLFQDWFRAPRDFGALLRYAWAGGSIPGLQTGGLVCVILGLITLRANWRKQIERAIPAETLDQPPGTGMQSQAITAALPLPHPPNKS
jgi:hypothetical protein